MYRNEDIIKKELADFYETLIEIAKADGVITDEELKILLTIEEGLKNLEDQLINVLKSELTDEEFRDLKHQILEDIIINTTAVAREDDVITEDEFILLERLREYANQGGIE